MVWYEWVVYVTIRLGRVGYGMVRDGSIVQG